MKFKHLLTVASLALATSATAATVSYSGTALTNLQGTTAADVPAGRLGLLILDTGGDGILGSIANTIAGMTVPTPSNAGLTIGSTFGGDLVVNTFASTENLGNSRMAGTWAWDLTAYPGSGGQRWAIVWFNNINLAGAPSTAPANSVFGIASATSWVTPLAEPANNVTRTYNTNPAAATPPNPHTIALQNGGTETVGNPSNATFATDGTTLTIVPEPSGAALGLLAGAGLLLRRRRN